MDATPWTEAMHFLLTTLRISSFLILGNMSLQEQLIYMAAAAMTTAGCTTDSRIANPQHQN